jgi:hypothetical protein
MSLVNVFNSLDSYSFVDVGCPLWNLSAESFSGLMTIVSCLNIKTSTTWRARFLYLYPPGTR